MKEWFVVIFTLFRVNEVSPVLFSLLHLEGTLQVIFFNTDSVSL